MSSHTLITMDQGDKNGLKKFLGKLYIMKRTFLLDLFPSLIYTFCHLCFSREMSRIWLIENKKHLIWMQPEHQPETTSQDFPKGLLVDGRRGMMRYSLKVILTIQIPKDGRKVPQGLWETTRRPVWEEELRRACSHDGRLLSFIG